MADIVNGRCHAKKAPEDGPPLFQHGNLVFQAHHVGWIITGCFTLASVITSFWLINKHLQWYTNGREQRYIVRILFMVPIYAVISFASYLFWNHSTPLLLLRDCYESTVLTSFFYLLLMYLSHDPEEQKEIFRKNGLSRENDREVRRKGGNPRKWMFPLSFIKPKPQDGLYFLQIMKWGVLQYCVIRPTTTLAAVILDYAGLYCEDSWSPQWGHVYITIIISVSVSISMYCLLQLYMPVSKYLTEHKPVLKLFAVKAVVFLTFWQATFLSFLTIFGVVKDTEFMTADNINIGLGAILETFEMMLFAFLHIRAFSYRPYKMPPSRTARLRSLGHAMNFLETFRELWAGTIYMFNRFRGRETDMQARREAVLEGVFGRTRFDIVNPKRKVYDEKTQQSVAVSVDVDEMVHVGEERQWLGLGDNYAYGLKYQSRRERSEGLGLQIERELESRGYGRHEPSRGHANPQYDPIGNLDLDTTPSHRQGHVRGQRSWWRNAFSRASQSGNDHRYGHEPIDNLTPPIPRRTGRRASWMRKSRQMSLQLDPAYQAFEDPPPPSVIRSYKETRSRHSIVIEGPVQPDSVENVTMPTFIRHPQSILSGPLALQMPSSPPRQFKRKPPPKTPLPVDTLALPAMIPATESQSDCGDSFLGRAFPVSDASHSAEALSSTKTCPTSSYSHQSGVRLGGDRTVVVNRAVVAQAPVVVQPQPYVVTSQEHIVESPSFSIPPLSPSKDRSDAFTIEAASPAHRSSKRHSSHGRHSAQYQEAGLTGSRSIPRETSRSKSGNVSRLPSGRTSYPPDPHLLRRENIVLPAPLAATATSPPHPLLQPAHHLGGSPRSPPPTSAPRPSRSSTTSTSRAHVGFGPRHPALSSPSRPIEGSSESRSPTQLRRSSHNVKQHSYSQVQRSTQERPSRRLSAPSQGSHFSLQSHVHSLPDDRLHSVPEDGVERH